MKIKKYLIALVLTVFWALTVIYNNIGSNEVVSWIIYIMTVKESLIIFLLFRELSRIKDNIINAIAVLFSIGMVSGYGLYRFYAWSLSESLEKYKEYIGSDYVGLIFSCFIIIFLFALYFTIKRNGKG